MQNQCRLPQFMSRGWAPALALIFGILLTTSMLLANEPDVQSPVNQRPQARVSTLSLPLYFEENRGQTDPSVRFINRAGGSTTFFRVNDIVMRLPVSDRQHRGGAVVQMQFLRCQ